MRHHFTLIITGNTAAELDTVSLPRSAIQYLAYHPDPALCHSVVGAFCAIGMQEQAVRYAYWYGELERLTRSREMRVAIERHKRRNGHETGADADADIFTEYDADVGKAQVELDNAWKPLQAIKDQCRKLICAP